MFITNKLLQKEITHQNILDHSQQYMNRVYDKYQAQPLNYKDMDDEFFAVSLMEKYPLLVDETLVCDALLSCRNFETEYEKVKRRLNVLYKCLTQCTVNLDIISLRFVVREFLTRKLYDAAINWVIENAGVPKDEIQFCGFSTN